MQNENPLPNRKPNRLKNYDYSAPGAYFITICVKNHEQLLSCIITSTPTPTVGTGVLDCPKNILSSYGKIADKYINQLNEFYNHISIDKYVIMPNHIHMIISILDSGQSGTPVPTNGGQSGTPVPTICKRSRIVCPAGTPVPTIDKQSMANAIISKFVSTFKRFCNKEYGGNIWQYRYHDHIIRNKIDYDEIWKYIDENPLKWELDKFYTE